MTPEALAATYAAAFPDSRPWSAQEIADLLAQKGCVFAGDADSFAIGRAVLDEVELLTIATAPHLQRQGLGAATLVAFETAATARGVTTFHLEVADDNIAAKTLYEKSGYAQVSRRKAYYPRPNRPAVDAITPKSG